VTHQTTLIHIDGSQGEGGGQILRTALGLSMVTGRPFRIEQIRARRSRPGLLRQHLTCVDAAMRICGAQVEGAVIGSSTLEFTPGKVNPGSYSFAVGTAGSAALVLQSVLPALLCAHAPSELTLEGGTHNPLAPPFDFLDLAYAPLLARLGARLDLRLQRRGFFPAGGGRFSAHILPAAQWTELHLEHNRGQVQRSACALMSALDPIIGERELSALRKRLELTEAHCQVHCEHQPSGPGNALLLTHIGPELTEVFSGFGERGVSAEKVAAGVANQSHHYQRTGAAVGPFLGDQLMLPMALGAGGSYTTSELTGHARSNAQIIQRFLPVRIEFDHVAPCWRVRVERR
jgi:RNA 3'-terminal phosphate cyclase (ATP)